MDPSFDDATVDALPRVGRLKVHSWRYGIGVCDTLDT